MSAQVVVIPTYNEKDNIEPLAREILSLPNNFDILFVDDKSSDGTGELALALSKKDKRINLLSRPHKLGLGTAYIDGFRWALSAGYDYICEMDADFSHNPKYLPVILKKIEEGYDLVLGSRYMGGISAAGPPTPRPRWAGLALHRRLISYLANKHVQLVTGMRYTDCLGGFKCFRRKVLEAIDLGRIISHGYAFQMEMLYRAHRLNFKVGEVPIIFASRASGLSKMSRKEIWEAFITVLKMPFVA